MASSLRLILSAAAVIVTSACVCVSSAEAPPSVGRHLQARDCKGTWSPWSECMPLEGHNSHHDQGDIWDLAEDKEASVQLCFKVSGGRRKRLKQRKEMFCSVTTYSWSSRYSERV
eukprot:GHVT01002828.1.p1 GENE.GHVT01002828.1~~GHVT01002828.1.p1  ORF type:complete len:115 (-),score=13.54 GHVT01002828.1:420-764(-)